MAQIDFAVLLGEKLHEICSLARQRYIPQSEHVSQQKELCVVGSGGFFLLRLASQKMDIT